MLETPTALEQQLHQLEADLAAASTAARHNQT